MKKNITYVDAARFETIIVGKGLTLLPQAGFIKISGAKGRNLYVANTKRVGRVDLSGFTTALPGVRNLGGEAFGAVSQQLDFSLPEAEVLANFEAILTEMLALPPREVVKANKPGKVAAPKPAGWSDAAKPLAALDPEAAAKRLALLEKVAKEKGVKVSKKAIASSPMANADK